MKKIVQQGNWQFELKQVFARKTAVHGQPFAASAVITVTDGQVYVELLTNKNSDSFTRADFKDIKAYINKLGFEEVHYSRFKNNEKREVEVE